ncbi:hypothetical protein FLX08_07740 [Microbispora hainanensis]|uniref:Uncharacterized protein n=1 Tax=Microbispora hainanensis TaxID=568844 RepID=A0A544Z0X7_9ACTN|nr:hypothetical protein FLX08_07740 [Microbispora hainanensis]
MERRGRRRRHRAGSALSRDRQCRPRRHGRRRRRSAVRRPREARQGSFFWAMQLSYARALRHFPHNEMSVFATRRESFRAALAFLSVRGVNGPRLFFRLP